MRGPARLVAAWALPLALAACTPERPGVGGPPSLLLVTLDTVRADRLGCYGHAPAATPHLDGLCASGMRFEHAVAPAPLTLPTHATLLSGLPPPEHGVRNNGSDRFPDELPTLATHLRGEGYDTAAFVGAFVLDRRFGLAAGFDLYDDAIARPAGSDLALESERSAAEVVEAAVSWLRQRGDRPFFAWVHLYDAHAPYVAPEPYRSRHADAYDAEIAFVDAAVGRLLSVLETTGARPETVVAVVGDHGEDLGEHGEPTHGLLLYETVLRVPWIVSAPGVAPAKRVVETPVSLADVAPTLAALVGRPFRPRGEFPGRDLAPALAAGNEPEAIDIYSETRYPEMFGWAPLAALRRGTEKLISGPEPELYDLASDPGERRDRSRRAARRVTELRAGLERMAAGGPRPSSAPDAEIRTRLAALGYISGASPAPGGGDRPAPGAMLDLYVEYERATRLLRSGEAAAARAVFRRLAELDPDNPIFHAQLGRACRQAGDPVCAATALQRSLELAPDDADAWYELAVLLKDSGRPAEALGALRSAMDRGPERPEARNTLGVLLASVGRVAEAVEEFQRVVEADPRNVQAWNNLGNVLRAGDRLDEAEDAYLRALALDPEYADPYNGLGALEVGRKRPAEALPWFDQALARAPDQHELRLNRAIAYQMAGDRAAAAAGYREFLTAVAGDRQYDTQRRTAQDLLAALGDGGPEGGP